MTPPTQTPHHRQNPHTMGHLEFSDEEIDPILAGDKTATIRYKLNYQTAYRIGRKFHLTTKNGDIFATAVVSDRAYKTARSIVKNGVTGHENYDDMADFYQTITNHHPEIDLEDETCFEIIHWEYSGFWPKDQNKLNKE